MGTYYYIVCHDCKVEQAAASTSCGNSPGHLSNSDTHLLPFIVEHAGHNTQCVSEHHDGANQDYADYDVKPEWQARVERRAGGKAEDGCMVLVGREQYDLLAKSMGWRRDPIIAPLRIPSPWLMPDGRPPSNGRSRLLPIPPMLRNRREIRFACMAMGMPGRFSRRPWHFGGAPLQLTGE